MRIFKVLSIVVLTFTFFSCEPTYEKEYSWAYPIAGDWKVNAFALNFIDQKWPFDEVVA